jgi:hypothetical protein
VKAFDANPSTYMTVIAITWSHVFLFHLFPIAAMMKWLTFN